MLTLWNCRHLPLLHQRSISLFAAVGPAMQVQTDGRTCGWTLCHFTDPAQHIMQAVPITSFIMGISSHQFSLIKTRLQLFYIVFLLCKQVASGFYCVRNTHTHTCLTALFPGLPRWASTRKIKAIWILLEHETVSGGDLSWAICKSASCSRQTTMLAPHHSVLYRPDALPATQPTVSKHWRQWVCKYTKIQWQIADTWKAQWKSFNS